MSVTSHNPSTDEPQRPSAKTRNAGKGARLSAGARSRLATRERLLDSGRFLFAKHGLHGITTHDIAKRAEVAAGTFYLHFKNKREIFREIIQDSVVDLIEAIEAAIADADDVADFVRAQAHTMVSFAEANREVILMLFSADSDASAVESDVLNQLAETIAEGRRERLEAGDAPNDLHPEILGRAVVGMWAQVLSWWCQNPARAPRETVIDTLTQIQLTGTHSTQAHKS